MATLVTLWPITTASRTQNRTIKAGSTGNRQLHVSAPQGRAVILMRRASASAPRPAQPVPDTLIMFSASGSRSRWIAGALLICASIWFAGLEYRGLFVPDEGRYAAIARELLYAAD